MLVHGDRKYAAAAARAADLSCNGTDKTLKLPPEERQQDDDRNGDAEHPE
jgi:phage FluMu gp28-like protein